MCSIGISGGDFEIQYLTSSPGDSYTPLNFRTTVVEDANKNRMKGNIILAVSPIPLQFLIPVKINADVFPVNHLPLSRTPHSFGLCLILYPADHGLGSSRWGQMAIQQVRKEPHP